VHWAAKVARAHEFILTLKDGYETIIGDRGFRLSGGQRQRLGLARALVHDPEILVLDEATSALDSKSEKLIQESLEEMHSKKTILIIAHRLSTIRNADQIVVIDGGQIREQGSQEKLLAKKGYFYEAWRVQTENEKA
jgi:ATP-binding cassette subfamily B protein/subfamily B ATP-binding cassette protein MsbA